MKIEKINTYAISAPLAIPLKDTNEFRKTQNAVIVEIITDDGIIGIGESGWFGGPPKTTKYIIDNEIAPLLINEDPRMIEKIWQNVYYRTYYHGRFGLIMLAMSGIDIALWDILGKYLKTPLFKILGGMKTFIPAYASAGSYDRSPDPTSLANELKEWVDKGFKGVKMRVGQLPISQEIERVKAVREIIGNNIKLMVDANGKLNPKQAINLVRAIEDYDIFWIEEPTNPDNVSWSAEVRSKINVPVAGYELTTGLKNFRDLIINKAVDIVQADAVWVGGISECRRVANLAYSFDLPFVPHVHSTAIALAANLHIVASIPNSIQIEIDQENVTMMRDIIKKRIDIIDNNSNIKVGDRCGLGIELNHEIIKKYIIKN